MALCVAGPAWVNGSTAAMARIVPGLVDANRRGWTQAHADDVRAGLELVGAGYVQIAQRTADVDEFTQELSTSELLHFLANLDAMRPYHGFIATVGAAADVPNNLVAYPAAPDHTNIPIESSLPASGVEVQLAMESATGLGMLRDRIQKFNVGARPAPIRFPLLTDGNFRMGLCLIASAIRAAADVAIFNSRASRYTMQLTCGVDAGLDARLEALFRRRLGDWSFDSTQLYNGTQLSIAHLTSFAITGRDGVTVQASVVPDFTARLPGTLPCVHHPAFRGALLGDVRGPGGTLHLDSRHILDRAAGYLWDGALDEDICAEDCLGAFAVASKLVGLKPQYSYFVKEADPDLRRDYYATLEFPNYGACRISDAAPDCLTGQIPMAWWTSVPLEGQWSISGWDIACPSHGLYNGQNGRGEGVARNNHTNAEMFGVAQRYRLPSAALAHALHRASRAGVINPPGPWDRNDPGAFTHQIMSVSGLDKSLNFMVVLGARLDLVHKVHAIGDSMIVSYGMLWKGSNYSVPSFLRAEGVEQLKSSPSGPDFQNTGS